MNIPLLGDDSPDLSQTAYDDPEDLLYDGETIDGKTTFNDNTAIVTTHRILVFTPEQSTQNFHELHRPNVTGVTARIRGSRLRAALAILSTVTGVSILSLYHFGFFQFITTIGTDLQAMIGDLPFATSLASLIPVLISLTYTVIIGLGILTVLIGLLYTLLYVSSRQDQLVFHTPTEPYVIPCSKQPTTTALAIRTILNPDENDEPTTEGMNYRNNTDTDHDADDDDEEENNTGSDDEDTQTEKDELSNPIE